MIILISYIIIIKSLIMENHPSWNRKRNSSGVNVLDQGDLIFLKSSQKKWYVLGYFLLKHSFYFFT